MRQVLEEGVRTLEFSLVRSSRLLGSVPGPRDPDSREVLFTTSGAEGRGSKSKVFCFVCKRVKRGHSVTDEN